MDHSLAITQIILTGSLSINGLWVGNRLVLWCQQRPGRLLMTSLSLIGLEALLFYLYVFAPIASEPHVFVVAVTCFTNGILLSSFSEWIRILPHPWGRGEARDTR
jgi:hypothetical protein